MPAFYFHKIQVATPDGPNTYIDIVDGQQRINALHSFSEGAFPLLDPSRDLGFRFPNFVKDTDCPWGGQRYEHLTEELKTKLREHEIVVYEITTDDENSIRDLFIRLQGGTPLTPQDKRDAWPGNFTDYILTVGGKGDVPKWYGWDLFIKNAKVGDASRRRQLAAQIFMLFWAARKEKKFCDIKSENIDEFYHSQVGFDKISDDAKRFERICKTLSNLFSQKPRLAGHYLIHLVLLIDSLIDRYAGGWEVALPEKLNEFEKRRAEAAKDVRNRRESKYPQYFSEYGQWTQTRSDSANSIRRRHVFFVKEMLTLLSPKKLDEKRQFTEAEREIVFYRDEGVCQWCLMKEAPHLVSWEDCEVHHINPYAKGGTTEIENGALVDKKHHPKGEENESKFLEWWKASRSIAGELSP